MRRRAFAKLSVLIAGAWLTAGQALAQNLPAVTFDSLLNTYFDASNGTVAFDSVDLAFAPDQPLKAVVVIVGADNKVVASFPFLQNYAVRNGVFARARVEGTPAHQLTEPGIYNIVVMIDGQMATRLPVALVQTGAGDDPFDPQKTFRFDGLWRSHAYFTMDRRGDTPRPQLNLWLGSIDLPEGKARDAFTATLLRDGEPVAHTKTDVGTLYEGHYDWQRIDFFHPHERKDAANARFFTAADLLVDGSYVVQVARGSDCCAATTSTSPAARSRRCPRRPWATSRASTTSCRAWRCAAPAASSSRRRSGSRGAPTERSRRLRGTRRHAERTPMTRTALVTGAARGMEAAVARAREAFGRLDALVNNAGIADFGPILATRYDTWRRIMATNLDGPFLMTQAVAPLMVAAGGGAVVNVTSISGHRASTLRVAYGTSKAALAHLTQQQAAELGEHGIRVNAVAPGPVDTAMSRKVHDDAIRAAYHDAIPLNRYGEEREIASAIVFLCSEEASYITGQVLSVDGGFQSTGIGLPALRREPR